MPTLLEQPRLRFATLPTPLQRCDRLRAALVDELGDANVPAIYMKRDDQTGLALGGNKTRKLEYLVADAQSRGATHLITEGGWQSNHCRQTAAAARYAGMRCTLVMNYSAEAHGGHATLPVQGNLLLDKLYGAACVLVPTGKDRKPGMKQAAVSIADAGGVPYAIPTGGSNAIGSLGYVNACVELAGQYDALGIAPCRTYSAWGSGGTFAGLIVGAAMLRLPGEMKSVLVVPAQQADEAVDDVWPIVTELGDKLGVSAAALDEQRMRSVGDNDHIGPGYGVPTAEALNGMRLLIDTEAVLTDPVYTAKAFAGMLTDIRAGHFGAADAIVFLHTGGQAVLFDPLHPLAAGGVELGPVAGTAL